MTATSSIEGIAIAGATASGKSALALKLARKLGGVVINADSAQVYADLRVLSARPSLEDEALAPHALYGHIDGAASYSAAAFARDAEKAVERQAGRFPILAGGTGLYFRALFEGLVKLPPIPPQIREKWRTQGVSTAGLHAELEKQDPKTAAGIMKSDRQRITRALEVIETTGKSFAELRALPAQPKFAANNWLRIILDIDRVELEARIAQRSTRMLELGAIEEIERLLRRELDPSLPVMKAIGVPEISAYLGGKCSLDQAGAAIALATRQYAKRQQTWFRNQMPGWQRLSAEEAEKLADGLGPKLNNMAPY